MVVFHSYVYQRGMEDERCISHHEGIPYQDVKHQELQSQVNEKDEFSHKRGYGMRILGGSLTDITWLMTFTQKIRIPSGKRLHNYGKSPFSMEKSIINHHFQWENPL